MIYSEAIELSLIASVRYTGDYFKVPCTRSLADTSQAASWRSTNHEICLDLRIVNMQRKINGIFWNCLWTCNIHIWMYELPFHTLLFAGKTCLCLPAYNLCSCANNILTFWQINDECLSQYCIQLSLNSHIRLACNESAQNCCCCCVFRTLFWHIGPQSQLMLQRFQ